MIIETLIRHRLDIVMPHKDGVTAHNEIKDINPDVKVLMMSAYPSDCLGAMNKMNYIQKPMKPDMLFKNIRGLIDFNQEVAN